MQDLQIFKNEDFGEIRTVKIKGKPYFVGKDVVDILGYQNGSRDINRHVDEEDRYKTMVFDGNQNKETIIINESGLYSLILSSKLPTAKKFKHLVTSEVLPAIRKHGAYAVDELLNDPDMAIKAFTALKEEREKRKALEAENDIMKPKALFADSVASSDRSILIGELAKILCQNGGQIGQNRLFQWMRDNGYLIKQGARRNQPKQSYVEMGLFELKESCINNPDGSIRVTITTKITGKGQIYFVNKFLAG